MPCDIVWTPQPTAEDILNQERNEALEKIEQELGAGTARLETNPITGQTSLVGATVTPRGMADLCVLAALQQRNSLQWQLAVQAGGAQNKNFAAAHNHAHATGQKH